ncbi:hypothetical protein WMY93_001928 [Mugilogobius chulae]|uniref:Gypsy retrotransposon integrase-like protein 1 n=1 Tax=Mugilogobius chulae TaxID=88201 RepID=A0AAW0Q220_9GOBI
MLIEQLCKCCWETCPFCSAVCTNTVKDHSPEKHCVPFHRPAGVTGCHEKDSNQFDIDFCTTLVASDKVFYPEANQNKAIPCKHYQTAGGKLAEWQITPNGSMLVYWKWFICRFQKDIEDHHQKKFQGYGEIPIEWKNFSKEEAIESLEKCITCNNTDVLQQRASPMCCDGNLQPCPIRQHKQSLSPGLWRNERDFKRTKGSCGQEDEETGLSDGGGAAKEASLPERAPQRDLNAAAGFNHPASLAPAHGGKPGSEQVIHPDADSTHRDADSTHHDADSTQRQGLTTLPRLLQRQDRENPPSESALRDQLLLGLRDGPLAQALRVYARRNPELDFADLREEAMLLESEYGRAQQEVTCAAINKQYNSPRPLQDPDWKEQLKREIMDDVKLQMKGLSQDIVAELKPLLQSTSPQPRSPNPSWNRPYTPRSYNDRDEQEVEGISVPERGVVIVEDKKCTHPLIVGMNVIVACWDAIFKCSKKSALPQPFREQKVWREAFATCRHVEVAPAEDGLVGYVRVATKRHIIVPPKSEKVVWGLTKMGPAGADYCALIEAMPGASVGDVGVAKALVEVRKGRVPVRVCNPHPYSVSIGRFKKLGRLYHVEETDVHGPNDLALSLGEDCVVEVALVDVGDRSSTSSELPTGVDLLGHRADLSEAQQEELKALLQKWEKVFAQHEEDFGRTNLVQHQIPTGDAAPIRERYRPIPPMLYKEVKTLLSGMLEKGVIKESCSPWAAPIVLVRKKDGSWRFCVDYRKLNSVTHKDAFPLPRIEETLTNLSQSEWFSTLDLASGYWQVEMHPSDREKTAFTTPLGLYEFERMPFGLCNAPATFQRLMQQCLNGQIAESLLVYLDDIIIYSANFSSHLQHLDQVFERLWRHGLKLRPDKCKLLQPEVTFLGHVVDRHGVRPDPGKIDSVLEWPIPTTIKQVRAFLGLAGYYRRFVAGFAKIARPLNRLLTGIPADKRSQSKKVTWTLECQTAFDALKTALTQAPVLAYAHYDKPFIVYTDASNQGLGAVLSQLQDGHERVIAYASRSLHPTEQNDANYSSFKLELLALKWAVTEKFKDFLTGAEFTIYTDNNPLAHLQTAHLGAAEQRWVAQLASFNYTTMAPAEQLAHGTVIAAAVEVTPEVGWEEEQASDSAIKAVKEYVVKKRFPKRQDRLALLDKAQKLLQQWKKLTVRDNILYRTVIDKLTHEEHHQVVCPSSRCEEVWRKVHEAGAHFGPEKTLARIRQQFFWPGMEGEVRTFHQKCAVCNLQKSRVEPRAELHPIRATYPLEIIGLDFLTLGRPTDTYQNILVATDLFTRFAWAIPTTDQSAQTTVKMIWKYIIQQFGCPARFHSDRGPNFESALMQQLCDLYGIGKSRTTSYHPAGNGSVERFNQTLLNMLRSLEEEKQRCWQHYLPELIHAYNNTVHSATGYAPSFLMFGRHLRLPVDVDLGVDSKQPLCDLTGWVEDHHSKLTFAYNIARQKAGSAASQQKLQFDKNAKALPLVPGERVLLRNRRREGRGKLSTWWDPEPHVVLDRVGDTGVVYLVRPERGGREQTVHRNSLKICTIPLAAPEPPLEELPLETNRPEPPMFYGFLPTAPEQQLVELEDAVPRRSARVNFGRPPARYRD